jgi:hypothetical protein
MGPRTVLIAALVAAPLTGPVQAQPLDPQTQVLENQIAAEQDALRRQAEDAQRQADVERQRLETEQRVQAMDAARRPASVTTQPTPPIYGPSGSRRELEPYAKPSQDKAGPSA